MYIDWNGDLEWSTGERAHRAPYDEPGTSHRFVTGCEQWLDNTGDNHVAVDRETGCVLGCEDDYPYIRNVAKRPPVYLHMFHGRDNKESDIDGWGFNGPTIGPLDWVHMTYMCHLRGQFQDGHEAKKFGLDQEFDFRINEDCLEFDGKLYGDWSISTEKCTGLYAIDDEENGRFEATHHEAVAKLQPGQKLICCSGDGRPVVAVG